ncbi:cbl-interacting serine/threonine-protein kinase [Anaeramoeba flamelloides]|uniref:Cbl-interacting serine/threonine-protein kinase n=1 Tax=Anaeramoeba flamelloides TaxID=1746091 RepID=A0AAV7YA41_9EUKA|nr:cbl-interacting serine/threonine-protein kinase [Anaeramoeba flamelloides]
MSGTNQLLYKVLENYKLTNNTLNSEQLKVYQAIHLRTQIRVCINVVSKKQLKEKPNTLKKTLKNFCLHDHRNLVQLFETLQDKNNYYLVLENFKGRPLNDFLKFHKHSHQEKNIKSLLVQFICLWNYFQKNKVNLSVVNESSIFVDQNFNLKVNIFSPKNSQFALGGLVKKLKSPQKKIQEHSRRINEFFLKFVIGIFLRHPLSGVTTNEQNFHQILNKFSESKQVRVFVQKIFQAAQKKTKGPLHLDEIQEHQWIIDEYDRYLKYLKRLETVQEDILNTIRVNENKAYHLRTKLVIGEDDQEKIIYKMFFNQIKKSKCLKLNLCNNQEKVDLYLKKKISQIKKCLNPYEIMQSEILEMENTPPRNCKESTLELQSENESNLESALNTGNLNSQTKTINNRNLNNFTFSKSKMSSDSFSDSNIFQSLINSPHTKGMKLMPSNQSTLINEIENKQNQNENEKECQYVNIENKRNLTTNFNIIQEERKQQKCELEKMLGDLYVIKKSNSHTFLQTLSNPKKVLKNQIKNSLILNNNEKTNIKKKNHQRHNFDFKDPRNEKEIEQDQIKKNKKMHLVKSQLNRIRSSVNTTNSLYDQFSPSQLTRIHKKWRNNSIQNDSKYEHYFSMKEKSKSNPNIISNKYLFTNSPSLKNLHQMRQSSRNENNFSRSFDFISIKQKNNNKIYPNKKNTNTFENFPNNLAIIKLFNLKAFKVKKNKLLKLLQEIFLVMGIKYKKTQKDIYLCSTHFQNKTIKFEIKFQKNIKTKLGRVTFKRLNCNSCIFHNLWADIYDIYTNHF